MTHIALTPHLVDVYDPPAGVLAVGDNGEVDEVVSGVAGSPKVYNKYLCILRWECKCVNTLLPYRV